MKRLVTRIFAAATITTLFCVTCSAADSAAGKAVYEKKCKMCHGASGEGNPGMAKALNVTIANLSSADVQKLSDADIKKAVTEGKGKMKPVAGLSDADVDNVIAYVRTLKK